MNEIYERLQGNKEQSTFHLQIIFERSSKLPNKTMLFSQRFFLLINYYLHQLKIGTILQKPEVSFLYKAVVDNAFQLYQQLNTILRASFSQSCNQVGKELKTQSTFPLQIIVNEVVTFRKIHFFSQRSAFFKINYYNKSSLHSFRRGTNIIFTRGSRKKLADFLNF